MGPHLLRFARRWHPGWHECQTLAAIGVWLAAFSSGLGGRVLGVWMAGSGLNYVPLAAYAIALSRSGALDAELAGVDKCI